MMSALESNKDLIQQIIVYYLGPHVEGVGLDAEAQHPNDHSGGVCKVEIV